MLMPKELKTSSHEAKLKKYIKKNVDVQEVKRSHHDTGHKCACNNHQRITLKIAYVRKYHSCATYKRRA